MCGIGMTIQNKNLNMYVRRNKIMIKKLEKFFALSTFGDIRAAFIARSRLESGRIADTRQWMQDNGFDLLDIPEDLLLTDDGREVIRAHGKAWALKPEIHAARRESAIADGVAAERARREQGQSHGATCTALIDGQLCGGALIKSPVCPRCALGKSGVAATLTCDVCGHVTAVMRGDS